LLLFLLRFLLLLFVLLLQLLKLLLLLALSLLLLAVISGVLLKFLLFPLMFLLDALPLLVLLLPEPIKPLLVFLIQSGIDRSGVGRLRGRRPVRTGESTRFRRATGLELTRTNAGSNIWPTMVHGSQQSPISTGGLLMLRLLGGHGGPGGTAARPKLVLKPDPVLTPILAIGNQLELLLEKRMVRMCYSETSNFNIAMRRS
jgi:hypothetical protein